MPMRRELRKFYGPKWRRKRARALALRGHMRCDQCGLEHRWINWAHLSGDPRVPGALRWLCPICHGILDTPRRIATTRRTQARLHGQMWLSQEIELADLPVRLLPESLAQMELFVEAA